MSHYPSKGDRSESQLKKAGRSTGPGHPRSGASFSAVKGGGAGGPSPSVSASPPPTASLTISQSFSGTSSSGRPTTPGSSSNRGGKRISGPGAYGRSSSSGGVSDHGGRFRVSQTSGSNLQSQVQKDGSQFSSSSIMHPSESTEITLPVPRASNSVGGSWSSLAGSGIAPAPFTKQSLEDVIPVGAPKPPPPGVPCNVTSVAEPAVQIGAVVPPDLLRSSVQPSFLFQFGSISPGFMNLNPGMQIPARTNSAPPNLDEQKREQARFEASRSSVAKKLMTVPSGRQEGQVSAAAGNGSEYVQAVALLKQNIPSNGNIPIAGTAPVLPQQQGASQLQCLAQPSVQFPQGPSVPLPGHGPQVPISISSHGQVSPQHLQHMQIVAAQVQVHQTQIHGHAQAQVQAQAHAQAHVQAQAHAQAHSQQHQVLSQPTLVQQSLPQQGLSQQSLSQGMKYPQPMIAPPPGTQLISQQMPSPLTGQVPTQVHPQGLQLGPQIGGTIGSQLTSGISGSQYGSPSTNQFIQPQRSRAVKIVNPDTLEELRFDTKVKKGETFVDAGPTVPGTSAAGLSARVSSNGPPQQRPVNYASAPHHTILPSNINYYQQLPTGPYSHNTAPFYQSVSAKGVSAPGGPPVNTPPVRYNYALQTPSQGLTLMNHPATLSNSSGVKLVHSIAIGGGPAGPDPTSGLSAPMGICSVVGSSHSVMHTVPAVVTGRSIPDSSSPQSAGNRVPSSNGWTSGLVSTSASMMMEVPLTSPTSVVPVFKFGDVEATGSSAIRASSTDPLLESVPVQIQISSSDVSPPSLDNRVLNQVVGVGFSKGSLVSMDPVLRICVSPPPTAKTTISVVPFNPTSTASGTDSPHFRICNVSSAVPPATGDNPKVETSKSALMTKENSRKKKEQKINKQHQQPLTPPTEGELERKLEVLKISPSSATINSSVVTSLAPATGSTIATFSVKPALQGSHSGIQSSNSSVSGPIKIGSISDRLEGSLGTTKVALDADKCAGGKCAGLLSEGSDFALKSFTASSSDVEEGSQKPLKKISGKILSSTLTSEGKCSSIMVSPPTLKVEEALKVHLFSPHTLTNSTCAEPNLHQCNELSPKYGPGTRDCEAHEEVSDVGPPKSLDTSDALQNFSTGSCDSVRKRSERYFFPENVNVMDGDSSTSLVSSDEHEYSPGSVEHSSILFVTTEIVGGEGYDSALVSSEDVCTDRDALGCSSLPLHLEVLESSHTQVNTKNSTENQTMPTSIAVTPSTALMKENCSCNTETDGGSECSVEDELSPHVLQATSSSLTVHGPKLYSPLSGIQIRGADLVVTKALTSEVEDLVVNASAVTTLNLHADVESVVLKGRKDSRLLSDSGCRGADDEILILSGSPVENSCISLESHNPVGKELPQRQVLLRGSVDAMETCKSRDQAVFTSTLLEKFMKRPSQNLESVGDFKANEGGLCIAPLPTNHPASTESLAMSVPELKQAGSKKKKVKDICAKADAQGPTADLFTAYKAPEEKKLEEVRGKTVSCANPYNEIKTEFFCSEGKCALKEVDDWEDAAELPTPKIKSILSSVSSNTNFTPEDIASADHIEVKKYTRDYLMSHKDLHKDLPPLFEIRSDIAELLLNLQATSISSLDALPSPGRSLDRQSSGGSRLDRRNINVGVEDDRWTRPVGAISSPGRGAVDNRMEMLMPGPSGVFRPGQASNAGLMRMPAGMRPGIPPGIMPMGGLLPGATILPPHMMVPTGPGRNIGGVDADRWQRAPVGQKGLIPSPRTPLPAIHKTENRYQVGKISDEEQMKQRLIKGILNKLTPQNFDKLFAQVKEVNIDSAITLTGVISQIFDKALTEPTFCEMYAKFCVQLAVELPEFNEEDEKITFKRVLLNKCQEEFERGEREQEEAEKLEEDGEVKLTVEEREERRTAARRRMLGNIRFIGELYKKNMLTERIMHECIRKLLGEYQNPDEEDVEALCKLMSTIGRIIDHHKAKEHIDAYFKRMEKLSENSKLSSRLRFMLKDCIDLRGNDWMERRKIEGPKKIDELHRDAVQERQLAASSGRDRPPQRGGMVPGGGRRLGNDFAMRVPQSPIFPTGAQLGGGMLIGGFRGGQPAPGTVRSAFGQDVRMEDRLLVDSRPVPIPLSQRPSDEASLTLGPQGGLGRGLTMRQPLISGRSALADVPPIVLGDLRRPGMGPVSGFGSLTSDRVPYAGREEFSIRNMASERALIVADRPLLERPLGPERIGLPAPGRDVRGSERSAMERPGASVGLSPLLRPQTPPAPLYSMPFSLSSLPLTEEDLRKKSLSTITEYFSVLDMEEAAQCVVDFKSPQFHPAMLSIWVSDALEKKDPERGSLVKLLIYLLKEMDCPLLTVEQIGRGFELVLAMLEDTTVDVPRAPEYVAEMLGKLIVADVFTLSQVGKLLKEGGIAPGSLSEIGDALTMTGVILDTIRREMGETSMLDLYRASELNVEDFLCSDDKRGGVSLGTFLEKNGLHCLFPMIPVEKYFKDALSHDEPVAEILKWVEKNVPESIRSGYGFWRMVMTQVLRHCVPVSVTGDVMVTLFEKVVQVKIKKFASLLKTLIPGNQRAAEVNQRQYIVAVQLFANDLNHPPGLITALFSNLYSEDVISEQAFLKWQDDVKDCTPGRDKAIKETTNWFRWLVEAPEEGGDEEE